MISRTILKGWKILVVDDEPDSLEVAQTLLAFYGAEVKTAANGQEALDLLLTFHPRFILSDISMPVMDGWQLVYTVKNEPRTKDIPMIALTAHAMVGDRERVMRAGYHNYLTKPLAPMTFIQDLLKLLIDLPSFVDELQGVIL